MEKQKELLTYLEEMFPVARCELNYETPYQLLIATILSAQCTDKRVNMVTPKLFAIAPTPDKMTALDEQVLKDIIHSCGFYNSKAKAIKECSREIVEKYNGEMPTDRDVLQTLRGVGRKTANVVLNECFGLPVVAVDTHVHRVCDRLGISNEKDSPLEVERKIYEVFDKDCLDKLHLRLILFGRYHCISKKPKCEECKMQNYCKYYKDKYEHR